MPTEAVSAGEVARPWGHFQAWEGPSMGGRLAIVVTLPHGPRRHTVGPARRGGVRVAARIERWASILTRFDHDSALCRLNADERRAVPVRSTLAAILAWAADAQRQSDGIVDPTLLAERLAVEGIEWGPWGASARAAGSPWSLEPHARGALVGREFGVRFDLDGLAKGWLADRGLGLLARWPGAIVDADGDIAIRLALDDAITIGVAPPDGVTRMPEIVLDGHDGRSTYGVATSGTTVHRWPSTADPTGSTAHHLLDPRTRRPAVTDVIQATVVAGSAREAERLAKEAVIRGLDGGLAALDRAGAVLGIVVTASGDLIVTPAGRRHIAAA